MMLSRTLAVLVGVVAVVASASAYTPYQHEPLPLQFVESMAIMHPDSSLANTTVCWKGTHDRGVGTIPNSCTPGHVRNGALCYPDCKVACLRVCVHLCAPARLTLLLSRHAGRLQRCRPRVLANLP